MGILESAPDIRGDFKKAHDAAIEQPPATPAATLEFTPGGTLEQIVHTRIDDAARAAAANPEPDPPASPAAAFKQRMLTRQFNRARGQSFERTRGR